MTTPIHTTPPEAVARYLRRLERGLRPLPGPARTAALAEIAAHVADRCAASGDPVRTVLAALGDADALARSYLDAHDLSRARPGPAPGPLLAAVARATRALPKLGAGFAAILLYLVGASFALVAVMKPVAPSHVGLWWGGERLTFGLLSDPGPMAQERLGYWITPVALAAALACGLAAAALLRGYGSARRPTPVTA